MARKREAKGCRFAGCPAVEARPPYDELSHEIDENVLSVRVAKAAGQIKTVGGFGNRDETPSVRAHCEDARGNKCCNTGCAKLNVIPNRAPPPKRPDEEMFLLRASRQTLGPDEMRNSLEIELRTPRNYVPLPVPEPTPTKGEDGGGAKPAPEPKLDEEGKKSEGKRKKK